MMTGFDWGMGLGGWVWMILGTFLVIAIVWAVVTALPGRERGTGDDAAQILKARFARGEISDQEYEQARRVLGIR